MKLHLSRCMVVKNPGPRTQGVLAFSLNYQLYPLNFYYQSGELTELPNRVYGIGIHHWRKLFIRIIVNFFYIWSP